MNFDVEMYRPATLECVIQAAVREHVPADVLLAIGQHEAGTEGTALKNKDGSYDLGRTGINTVHVREAAKTGVEAGQFVQALMFDGCYNYAFAAYLLRRRLQECRTDYWTCVANYHSKTPRLNQIYQGKIRPLAEQWASFLRLHYRIEGYQF
ncbi:transglycosylase SLT domain-containing protein [Pandoraea communis]|uniref:transglycosylase SLT domain-containing protein n=1 Tax=Pandoraea communis TaxID=2508297 RepID=UPI0025A6178A|nr:transglycosylase SLT domain-containing protein [Pandoraea communis]MDM8356496.1 transglycosylase SLT domain-containing protein [Pandoraea communis]